VAGCSTSVTHMAPGRGPFIRSVAHRQDEVYPTRTFLGNQAAGTGHRTPPGQSQSQSWKLNSLRKHTLPLFGKQRAGAKANPCIDIPVVYVICKCNQCPHFMFLRAWTWVCAPVLCAPASATLCPSITCSKLASGIFSWKTIFIG